ncbi:MAG: TIGR02281 family clan AA aspartic protease [Pseudomonadota bacterium]
MWRYFIALAAVSVLTVKGIEHYSLIRGENIPENPAVQTEIQSEQVAKLDTVKSTNDSFAYAGRRTRIKMDRSGHFIVQAKMNGRRVEVLVDTGATSVAINKSTARRLGISVKPSDFKYRVSTANGKTKAASAYIDRIEIGRVTVKNVRAVILGDNALDGTLLGMTFLGELKGFEVKNRELILTQ